MLTFWASCTARVLRDENKCLMSTVVIRNVSGAFATPLKGYDLISYKFVLAFITSGGR